MKANLLRSLAVVGAVLALTGCGTILDKGQAETLREGAEPLRLQETTITETSVAEQTVVMDIFNYDYTIDTAVVVSYETEEPTVVFITPEGTELSEDGYRTERVEEENVVVYHILSAESGQWQMTYIPKNGDSIAVRWYEDVYNEPDKTEETAAVMKTIDIFNLDEASDMAVTIYYDVEEPTVSFIKPNGEELSVEGLRTERDDDAVCFHIVSAEPGQWQMKYDKKGNVNADVNWCPENYREPENEFEEQAMNRTN